MERRPSIAADELSLKILAFLDENPGGAFTVQEIAAERSVFSSRDKVQARIGDLLRKGMVKVTLKGRETAYQIVLRKSSSSL